MTSAAGAIVGQASGSPVKKVGPSIEDSSAFKALPSSVTSKIVLKTSTGNASNAIKTLEDMGVGAGGSVFTDAISGREISGKSALVSAGTSGMSSRVTDYTANKFDVVGNMTSQTGVTTLNQMKVGAPRSWHGLTNLQGHNTKTLYGSAIYGTGVGTGISMAADKFQEIAGVN